MNIGTCANRRVSEIALLALLIITLVGAGDQNARFNDLGHRLICICGCGQILLECNHVGCTYSDRMRAELAAGVDRGDSDDLTLQAFVQKYGTTVLAAPTTSGFNRMAWIVPYLALLLGLAAVVVVVRNWHRQPAAPAGVASVDVSPALDDFRERARRETEI